MASKTSASLGVLVFLNVSWVLALALLITSIILFAKVQRLTNDVQLRQNDLDAAVRADERDDRFEELKSLARNQGVIRYLDTKLQDLSAQVGGSRRDDPAALVEKIKAESPEGTALLPLLTSRNSEIENLKGKLAAAESAREAANADLLASVERVKTLEEEHRKTIASLNAEIDSYKDGTNTYRQSMESTRVDMNNRVSTIRSDSEATISGLESQARDLEQQLLIANDQLRRLKQEQAGQNLRGAAEEALVDGRIVGVNSAGRQAYIGLGRKDRLVLGMTFEVYNDASTIVPDEKGDYPKGKGTVEIIRIDENSSVARIIRSSPGSTISNGDVIANAIYDPKKVYTFTVYGNFDTNNDDVFTPQEIQDIRGLIESWNGKLADDITGDTDFLVLGTRPVLPPQPKPDDPVELIQRWVQLSQQATKYDELFDKAVRAGIPILNQNRLYTLTGVGGRR
ncbi:MAG: hypothetical protein JNK58_14170 [Phycisphaerae bacterium]|nr:hypothetical protein [Phycisphaerae bacterium]